MVVNPVLQVYIATEPTILVGWLTCPLVGVLRTGQRSVAAVRMGIAMHLLIHLHNKQVVRLTISFVLWCVYLHTCICMYVCVGGCICNMHIDICGSPG